MIRGYLLTGLAIALAACSPSSNEATAQSTQAAPSVHPISGLPVVPLKIRHGSKTFEFRVEVARTEPEQAKGLMFRTAMAPGEGMIFPFAPPRGASFWMRNTVIPLDLIFVANHTQMKLVPAAQRERYAYAAAGAMSQNVYLYCAANALATVIRAWFDPPALAQAMGLEADQQLLLCQTVGRFKTVAVH